MKQVLPTLIAICLTYNAFAQEDSIKTRHDKMFYPVASMERPVEIVTTSVENQNAEPVVSTNAETLKKPKASRKKIARAERE